MRGRTTDSAEITVVHCLNTRRDTVSEEDSSATITRLVCTWSASLPTEISIEDDIHAVTRRCQR